MQAVETDFVPVPEFLRRNPGLIGRTTLYELVKARRIPHVRIGRKVLIPTNLLSLLVIGGAGVDRGQQPN